MKSSANLSRVNRALTIALLTAGLSFVGLQLATLNR